MNKKENLKSDKNKDFFALTHSMIHEQLARILSSQDFQVPARLKNFLKFIVQETLHGQAGNIKAYSIAVEVFGRDEKFDPILDPIVRVEAGKLRRHMEHYYLLHPEDVVHISMPRGSYVPVFSYKGAPEVKITQAVDVNPHSHAPAYTQEAAEHPVSTEQPLSTELAQADDSPKLESNDINPPARVEHRPILAILPFTCIGEESSLLCFVDGLSENLLAEMTHSSDVDVLEAIESNPAKANLLDTIYKAKERGARFILHGRVQRSHEAVRIFAALTDAKTARRIWTEKFDAPFNENALLDVQDEITSKLVGWLTDGFGLINRTLLRESAHKVLEDIGVYEATLRYHAWVGTFDRNDYLNAKEALEYSYELDPEIAMVCALLSDIYSSDFEFGYDLIPDNLDQAMQLAQKALTLDPASQMARWAMGLNYYLRRNIPHMESIISKIYPPSSTNPYLFVSIGLIVGMTRDLAEGKHLVEEALRLNPYSPSWCHIVPFMFHYAKGNYKEALDEALQMNAPTCIWDAIARAAAYGKLGLKEEGEKAIQQLLELEPDFKKKQPRLLHSMVIDEKWVKLINEGLQICGL